MAVLFNVFTFMVGEQQQIFAFCLFFVNHICTVMRAKLQRIIVKRDILQKNIILKYDILQNSNILKYDILHKLLL